MARAILRAVIPRRTSVDDPARSSMRFHADLHVHSKYSRATSRDLDLEHLAYWAGSQGHRRGRHRRLHASGLGRRTEAEARSRRAGPVSSHARYRKGRRREAAGRVPGAGPLHARGGDLHDLQEGRPDAEDPSPDLRARLRDRGPHLGAACAHRQHRVGRAADPRPRLARSVWRSRWSRAPTPTWCRRISGRRGSRRSARSRDSIRSPSATAISPTTFSRSRPGSRPTRR